MDQKLNPKIVSHDEWYKAQKRFFEKEQEFNKMREQLAEERQKLPWTKIEKTYVFSGPNGIETLSDLFQGRSQLILQHFMFAPEWREGCSGCSAPADNIDGSRYHFEPKDVSYVAVSRAPIEKLEAYKKRMGWNFKWVSSGESEFNYDFHVSFTTEQLDRGEAIYNFEKQSVEDRDLPGLSVFYKNDAGEIYRTYSNFQGDQGHIGVYTFLDYTPLGRNEKSYFDWIKHHDKY